MNRFLAFAWLLCWLAPAGRTAEPPVAPPANLAAYGWLSVVDPGPPAARIDVSSLADATNAAPVALLKAVALHVEWQQPRPVRTVALTFADKPPPADTIKIEWWHRVWPDNGAGGWMKLDDPFNGEWTAARATVATNGATLNFRFAPLEASEVPGVKRTGLDFRQTYKLRITCAQDVRLLRVAAYSDAVLRRARLRFEWGVRTTVPGEWAPRFEARNSRLLAVNPAGTNTATVEVEYADAPDRLSPDRGYVVFRSGATRSFSVFVDDVLRAGGLFVRDLGVFVSDAEKPLTFRDWKPPAGAWPTGTIAETVARMPEQTFAQASRAFPAKPPRYCFLGAPNLRQEIAIEPRGDIILFADSLRSPGSDADVSPWRKWDTLRYRFLTGEHPKTRIPASQPSHANPADHPLTHPAGTLSSVGREGQRFGPDTLSPTAGEGRGEGALGSIDHEQGAPAVSRELEDGWLPVVHCVWRDGYLAWSQTCVAAPLTVDMARLDSRTGTEPLVLATRFTVTNSAPEPRTAWLWLELNHPLPSRLGMDGTLLLTRPSDGHNRPGFVPVRGRFDIGGHGELDLGVLVPAKADAANAAREAVRYRVPVGPGETRTVDCFVPYVELLDASEAAALGTLSFTNLHDSVVRYWRDRAERSLSIETPELWLNRFFKANLWHVLISTDLDPVTHLAEHGAATHEYKNFCNETMMVARSLDMRGERDAAQRLIETFLVNQGVKGLPGNFRSTNGVFYAAYPDSPDPYTAQGYNMHHGFALWAAAEHYFWTRDSDWLWQAAPRLVRAADWITRERQATMFKLPDGSRPVEFGLAPAGDLEDVEEYLYFYATDAYYHLGMKTAAAALAAAAKAVTDRAPANSAVAAAWQLVQRDAVRLARDAEAFRQDIAASVAEAVATSPVVALKDGSWVPYVPPRAYALTHRAEGWIREALYPALHLVDGEVFDAQHPFVDWMIQDLEDNIFLSPESGYGVADERAEFFDHGGFTLQPNLLDLALVYLQRDQVANFLRAFYNTAAVSLYPDTTCFAEWVPKFGEGGGPLYKTPDECKFVQWLREMLVMERGDTLELGLGVPRAWMADGQRVKVERAATYFGRLDLEIESHAAAGEIRAVIRLEPTVAPKALRLRLRHPAGRPIASATVNGRSARIDTARQVIELPPTAGQWAVVARFE